MTFTSQGLRFHLLRGIVFNGARFIEPKSQQNSQSAGRILARTENLALHFSILNYLRGLPPVHTIQMDAGRVLPGNRSAQDFWRLFERILAGAQEPGATQTSPVTAPETDVPVSAPRYLAPRLQFIARNIQIQTPGGRAGDAGRIRIDLQATMPDPELSDDVASFRLDVNVPGAGASDEESMSGGPLRSHGTFTRDGTGRLYFTLTDTPVRLIAGLLEETPLAPLQLTTRTINTKAAPGLRLRSGTLTGNGSFDVYPRTQSGPIGVNFKGRYDRLEARLYFAGGNIFELSESAGQFSYNGGFELSGKNSHFNAKLESESTGSPGIGGSRKDRGYKLELLHRDIEVERRSRAQNDSIENPAPEIDENRFSVKGFIHIADNIRLMGFEPGGNFQFDLSLDRNARKLPRKSRAARHWDLTGFLRGSNLELNFANAHASPAPAVNHSASNDTVSFESIALEWQDPKTITDPVARRSGNDFTFQSRGRFADGVSIVNGSGSLNLQPTPGGGPIKLYTNLNIQASIQNPQLASAIEFLRHRYQNVRRIGYDPESSRAEDAGPLWQNKFFESDFYRTIIENLRARARLEIQSALPAGTLPPDLAFVGRAENGYVRIESENGLNGGIPTRPEFQLKYESNLQAFLPRQDLQIQVRVPENQLSFENFTSHATPPASCEIRYLMGGEGILPGDLMQRTYSRLEIKASQLHLGRNRLLDIIRHEAGLPGKDIRLERLDLTRATDGSESSLRIRATAPDLLNVEGQGENLAGIGGALRLRFRYPGDPGADRSLKFRIEPNGGYVPEL